MKRLGESCASAAKMKPVGPMIRAQQADRDAHQEHKLRVEANKCYRVVFATDENVHDAVVVMRDSAGDIVAESAGAALPGGRRGLLHDRRRGHAAGRHRRRQGRVRRAGLERLEAARGTRTQRGRVAT